MEGPYCISERNYLRQLCIIPLSSPFVAYVLPRGVFHVYSWGLDMAYVVCSPLVTAKEGIDVSSALPARNNSRQGRYPKLAFGGISVFLFSTGEGGDWCRVGGGFVLLI